MKIQVIVFAFDIITTFFDYWMIYFIGSTFMSKKKSGIQVAICLLFFTIINMIFAFLIKDTFLISIMNLLFGYYIIKINYKGNGINKFMISILYYLFTGFYTFSTTFIAQSVFGIGNSDLYSITIERLNFILVTKVLLFCTVFMVKDRLRFIHSNELSLNKNSTVLVKIVYSILTIIMILLFIINRDVTTNDQHFYILVISFLIVLSTILIYYSIKQYADLFKENEFYKTLEKINAIERDNYNNMVKNNEEIRSIKHDMNNMLITLGHFIKEGEYDKSISVINSQLDLINQKVFYTVKNSILQAFLNYYVNYNSDIKFNLNLNIQQELMVDDIDFISLLGNLFKNSVEAVSKLNRDDKIISIIFKIKGEKIFIQFQNAYSNLNMVDGKIYTTKSDDSEHGFGLSNIKNIVDKYDGLIKINTENNVFIVQLMLDNRKAIYNVK